MAIVEVRLRGNEELARGLAGVERIVRSGGGNARLGRFLARESLRIVKKLTPRQRSRNRAPSSRRGHPPLFKQWDIVEARIAGGTYRAKVTNAATRTRSGLAVLAALEFGAKRHPIPKTPFSDPTKRMYWNQAGRVKLFERRSSPATRRRGPGGSDEIRDVFRLEGRRRGIAIARQVDHPGNKGFRMVVETRRNVSRTARVAIRRYAQDIRTAFAGRLGVGVDVNPVGR